MSKTVRLLLFLLFVLGFLISTPLVVLYTAGYRFDLTHGRIVHMAVLNIQSTPRGASITIDGVPKSERTPAVIETILPGDHLIRLQKTGYLPWETSLRFESRQARVLGPVALFLDEPAQRAQTIIAVQAIANPSSNQFAYLSQESSWIEAWVVHADAAEKKLLLRLPFDARSRYALSWSTRGTYLALTQMRGTSHELFVSRVSDGAAMELPASAQNAKSFWWDLGADERLYVQSGNTTTRVDLTQNLEEPLAFLADLASSYGNQIVTLSQSDNRSVISSQEAGATSIITYLPLGDYALVDAPGGLIALYDARHGRLALLNLGNRDQPIVFNEEAAVWKWNPSGEVLLYSSGYDLKRYTRNDHETRTLTRLSTQIDQLDWYPTGSALYQTGGQTFALNLDGTTILSLTLLLEGLSGTFWIDPVGKQMHILTETGQGFDWWTRNLQN